MPNNKRGGARRGAGRKPGASIIDDPRSVQKGQRYTESESELIERAAVLEDISPGRYIRDAAIAAAKLSLGEET